MRRLSSVSSCGVVGDDISSIHVSAACLLAAVPIVQHLLARSYSSTNTNFSSRSALSSIQKSDWL